MVTSDGRVKIADFGIAKATTKMQTGAFLTATGTTVGTPTYMAPEQAMAQDIGPWTDLYSVGCMAFELFSGNVPFHDSDAPMAILLRHVNEPIAPVKSIRPEVDQRISDWIEQLLVKDPTQRTQNAQDAWDDFEEIVLGLLGPRWRREARLVERVEGGADGAKPLTPAPFQGTSAGDPGSAEFKSFAWGAPAGDTGGTPAAPPMWTPPPSESTPSIPEPIVGPPTPMPSQAVPAPPPPAPPTPEPVGETGFVTFGQPAPAPPTDALVPPPAAAAAAAPAEEALAPTNITPTPAEVAPEPVVEAEPAKAFETYVAPPPSRPPTSEPALTPPPVAAVPAPPVPEPVALAPEPVAPAPEPVAPAPVADTMMPASLAAKPPKPPVEKAPAGESGGRPKWIIPAAIGGGVAVIGVVAALALGGGGGGEDPQPTPGGGAAAQTGQAVALASQGMALQVPAGWSDGGDAPQIPGLVDATSAGGPKGGAVVFGKADDTAANSTLLADDLRASAGALPEKTTVDIGGGAQAARYANLNIGDGKTATVYAVPTDAGVATLACTADEKTCETIASSLEIKEGTPFPIGPSQEYATDVEGILAKLEKAEKSAASRLSAARQRTSQAAATSRLAAAYGAAAAALGKLDVSPADATLNKNLADALRGAGGAYRSATVEARGKDRAGFKRQGARAVAAGAAAGKALDGYGAAGYELDAKGAAAVTRLPTLIKDKPKAKAKAKAQSGGGAATQAAPQQQSTPPQQQQTAPPQQQTTTPPQGGGGGGGRRRRRRRRWRWQWRQRHRRRRGLAKTPAGGARAPPAPTRPSSAWRRAACGPRRAAAGSARGTARRAARCRRSTRPTWPGPCRSRRRRWRSPCA